MRSEGSLALFCHYIPINKRTDQDMFMNIDSHLYTNLVLDFYLCDYLIANCGLNKDIAINGMKLCEFS